MIYSDYKFPVHNSKMIRVIVNTDAKNEADDQYAIVHALLSPRFDVRGLIAAHFGTRKRADSMQASYDEIIHLLDLMHLPHELVVKGAAEALPNEFTPQPSPGAQLIIDEAMKQDDRPLYVLFLGPLTDMASALMMDPRVADRCTCVWIGGDRYPVGGPEFNLMNDIAAANVVFRSNVPVWQVPRNVYRQVLVSMAELEYRVEPYGAIGKYLFDQLVEWSQTPQSLATIRTGEYWCLGDSPAVGLLLNDHSYDYEWIQAPEVGAKMEYIHTGRNRPIRVYQSIDSRFIMEDFYAKLALYVKKHPDA